MDYGKITETELDLLREIVGPDRVSTGESVLDLHGGDESSHLPHRPEVVVWPLKTEEVSRILALASDRRIPVTPWGAGTSLEGNPIPVLGGIVLDFQQMNRILEFRQEDLQVRVEPGLGYKDLNLYLARYGLFFPPDPGAGASIGGMIANNASGTRTIKYGATKDFVLSLVFVLPSGKIIRTGTNAIKSSSGYDLSRLFVGSEGTLGVVTEATLRLMGLPAEFMAAVVPFDTVRDITDTVTQIMQSGLAPAALELMDAATVKVVNQHKKLDLEEKPTLFVEFTGMSRAGFLEELEVVKDLCEEHHCLRFESGIGRDQRNRLWEARHAALEAVKLFNVGFSMILIDTAVPISKFPFMVEHSAEVMARRDLRGYTFGHAGSGNLHMVILWAAGDEAGARNVNEAGDEIVAFALECGGTATGEHGIGIGKRKFMQKEHGEAMEVMRGIKNLFDPQGIMNPGKMFE
jgi:D-lactate dehydrogenase (cytochrome)